MTTSNLSERQTAHSQITLGLLQLARQYRRRVDHQLAKQRLSEARAVPVLHIARSGGGMRQCELADMMGIEGPSLVRLLDQLAHADLVVRQPDPNDRRAKTLHLTPAGQALAGEVEDALLGMRDSLLAQISDDDIAATLRCFAALEMALKTSPQTQAK